MQPDDPLVLGDMQFSSRLLLGSGKFASGAVMMQAVAAAQTQIVTVALRRFDRDRQHDDLVEPLLSCKGVTLMPNTSGARNAEEAVLAARIARQLYDCRLIKVEIHPNPRHLMPDPLETFTACKILAADGWLVMPYIAPDPILAKRLEEVGCVSVMPLGSAIGSGQGLAALPLIKTILREAKVPVIIDAGLRAPSQAALAMELGCSAVLVNTAVADAGAPAQMAAAFAQATRAGRCAYHAGLMGSSEMAQASSPITAFLGSE